MPVRLSDIYPTHRTMRDIQYFEEEERRFNETIEKHAERICAKYGIKYTPRSYNYDEEFVSGDLDFATTIQNFPPKKAETEPDSHVNTWDEINEDEDKAILYALLFFLASTAAILLAVIVPVAIKERKAEIAEKPKKEAVTKTPEQLFTDSITAAHNTQIATLLTKQQAALRDMPLANATPEMIALATQYAHQIDSINKRTGIMIQAFKNKQAQKNQTCMDKMWQKTKSSTKSAMHYIMQETSKQRAN